LGETLVSQTTRKVELTVLEQKLSPWSRIAIDLSERLIDSGALSAKDWKQIGDRREDFLEGKTIPGSGEVAWAVLPAIFFFHDNADLLQEQLQHLRAIWGLSAETVEDVLIWRYAIALALREKLNPSQAITQILARYQAGRTHLIQQLEQVQTFLHQGTPLEQVAFQMARQGKHDRSEIALAFYCFASTPEDFRLCLMRATRMGKQAALVSALAGALAGAYNSFSGIPLSWRVALQTHPIGQKLARLAIHLFAVWAGVYQSDRVNLVQVAAVASPLVIQPRSSLKIISQGEYLFPDNLSKLDSKVRKK
jgi:hypothetical protein